MASSKIDDPRVIEFDVRTDEMLINMGPQHPSTHGVLRLVLRTDGEVVSDVEPHIGYLHRCAEKIGENLTARQWVPYTDRMDYLAAMNMNLGWSLVIEKMLEKTPSGSYHFSGEESMTKYEITKIMGDALGKSYDHVSGSEGTPGGAPRPKDCQLDMTKLKDDGFYVKPTSIKDVIGDILREHV